MWRFFALLWLLRVRGEPEVAVPTTDTKLVINSFTGRSHQISSGKIEVTNNNTFHITNFYFDGKAPEAYFIVGKGDTIYANGTKVPFVDSSSAKLEKEYNGEDITIRLPDDLTINDFDWLAIWCYAFTVNLGEVFFKEKYSPYPPQVYGLKNEVTSGPIVLVNKKTLFIPALRYKGNHKNVHFWVGNGAEPAENGLRVPDENGSLDNLHAYQGQNIYIKLPEGVSTDNIDYFGVWSEDEKRSLGHVLIKTDQEVPEPENSKRTMSVDEDSVMRLPKCCPVYSMITQNGCEKKPFKDFKPNFKVFEHNETHFSNVSLDVSTIHFEPYTFSMECSLGKYALNESTEEFAILQNGSLLLKGKPVSGILSQQHFCVENVEDEELMKIFVCVPEYKVHEAMFVAYVTLTVVSTFCFIGTFFLYFFWLKIEDIHRKCFTAYVLAMSITFLSLTIVQIAHVEGSGCEVLGFLFQIAMIASFTLLAILCCDIFVIVKYIDEDRKKRKRKVWYLVAGIGVPFLSLFISLTRNLTPDVPDSFFKPQYHRNACLFEAENQRAVYFYAPVIVSIVVSIVFLVLTKLKIVDNDRSNQNNFFWIEKGTTYKFMWRKHFIVVVTSLLWFIEAVINLNYTSASILIAIDVVEASQGIIVVLLFVANKETRTLILKRIKTRRRKRVPINFTNEENHEMINTSDS